MKSRVEIQVAASCDEVLALAAAVEEWPRRLPHYRYVRRLAPAGPEDPGRFAMGARRGRVPVRWEAVERIFATERRIEFRHTGGVTRGMLATWMFLPVDGGCAVSIDHELEISWPMVGRIAAEWIIGPGFIEPIARRTLRRVKAIAEARQAREERAAE